MIRVIQICNYGFMIVAGILLSGNDISMDNRFLLSVAAVISVGISIPLLTYRWGQEQREYQRKMKELGLDG